MIQITSASIRKNWQNLNKYRSQLNSKDNRPIKRRSCVNRPMQLVEVRKRLKRIKMRSNSSRLHLNSHKANMAVTPVSPTPTLPTFSPKAHTNKFKSRKTLRVPKIKCKVPCLHSCSGKIQTVDNNNFCRVTSRDSSNNKMPNNINRWSRILPAESFIKLKRSNLEQVSNLTPVHRFNTSANPIKIRDLTDHLMVQIKQCL